jgi:hypothetical protein
LMFCPLRLTKTASETNRDSFFMIVFSKITFDVMFSSNKIPFAN